VTRRAVAYANLKPAEIASRNVTRRPVVSRATQARAEESTA